jgi:surface protein
LNNWNVSNVTNMIGPFKNCSSFNQPLNNWNVSKVTSMAEMFDGCSSFNQPLNNWNVSNVTNMSSMFRNASSFNQSLETWNLRTMSVSMPDMLRNCGMNTENYSRTLIGWSNTVSSNSGPYNVTLGSFGRTYHNVVYGGSPNDNAVDARAFLTSSPRNWTITGDSLI